MENHQIKIHGAQAVHPKVSSKKVPISIVGLGYVGAVSAACFSHLGHRVVGVDLDRDKVEIVGQGSSPIHEDGLGEYLTRGVNSGLLHTTDDLAIAVRETDVTFVAVGTPSTADGGCDCSFIEQATRAMAVGLAQKDDFHVFALRSSIPPGTTLKVMTPILEHMTGKVAGRDFGVCFTPEFLREGVAIADFFNPPKTVIGITDMRTASIMRRLFLPIDSELILTDINTAEMVKYVDNVWHATKVCFANEVGRLCKSMQIDSHAVMDVFVQDQKLNLSPYYLKPGFAYGGSCLPKEVRALTHLAKLAKVDLPMISHLDASNREQITEAIRMVQATGCKRVGVLGLAFKAGTDDLRESPVLEVMSALKVAGCSLVAHDAAVTYDTDLPAQVGGTRHGNTGLRNFIGELPYILKTSIQEVISESEVLLITHDLPAYRQVVDTRAPAHQIIDLVHLFDAPPRHKSYQGIAW